MFFFASLPFLMDIRNSLFQSTSPTTYKSNLWRKNQSIYKVALWPLVFPLLSTSYLSLSPSSPILPPSSRVGSWTSSNLISHVSIVLAYCLSISSTSLQIKVSHRFWKYRSRRSYCSHIISQPSSWIPLTIGMWAYPLYKSRIQICCYCYYWTQLCVLSPDQTTCLNSLPTYDFLWQNWCNGVVLQPNVLLLHEVCNHRFSFHLWSSSK